MSTDDKLADIRKRIDEIDKKLIKLISDRAKLAIRIAGIKMKQGDHASFYRPEREAQVLRRAITANQGPLPDEAIAGLFRDLMSACLALEQSLKIAFLGPEGTFTHSAALKHFGHSIQAVALAGIDQVFHQVQSGECHYGVVPVENSIEGVVNHTLDMLINSGLKITGEVELRIHQHLMSRTRSRKKIKRIYSHQQSFAQCRRWLDTHCPGVERIPVNSNAEAARIARRETSAAAIAGESSAELYKLAILDRNIEDEPDNSTRFLIIAERDTPPSGNDKTSLLFSMPSRPGSLLKMLSCFAGHGVNMTRIESRPSRQGLWEYVFFVDVDGHVSDNRVAAALKQLQSEASMVKILGSYPKAVL
jgi:chorismate mutase/prephenate dehydratase